MGRGKKLVNTVNLLLPHTPREVGGAIDDPRGEGVAFDVSAEFMGRP